MKILLCNVPIRATPDPYPPVACTSLCSYLIKAGYDPEFYDINTRRTSIEELSCYFRERQFDIVGISAVVSTGYLYTKRLTALIKETSPSTGIILGGNLAAAYEVILRKCGVDVCVIGRGEDVLLNLVRHREKYNNFDPVNRDLYEIKRIGFLDGEGNIHFTGYGKTEPDYAIEEQPNYEMLDRFSNIGQYIVDPLTRYDFACDPRSHEPHRRGQKMATIFTSKGCINRCTFCHRWIGGYRVIPVRQVVETMKHLKERYNVGFFCISDECFGENEGWNNEFIELVRPLDILFQIGGARVSIVRDDSAVIKRLKAAGLTAIYFGVESGSDKILKVMEKNATKEENLRALKICAEAGIYTVIQLVIGMPGENDSTIDETIRFLDMASEDLTYFQEVSINYLQALPGTPTYEYLRYHGLLGNDIDDEEKYLLRVSDVNASEFGQYVNVSEEPLSRVKLWRMKIWIMNSINWLKHHGWKPPQESEEIHRKRQGSNKTFIHQVKYFMKNSVAVLRLIDLMGNFFWKSVRIANCFSLYGVKKGFMVIVGLAAEENRSSFRFEALSLKRFLNERTGHRLSELPLVKDTE